MNIHQKVEGHKDNTAVAKSFLPTSSPFRRQQEILELKLLDEQNLYPTVLNSSDPPAEPYALLGVSLPPSSAGVVL